MPIEKESDTPLKVVNDSLAAAVQKFFDSNKRVQAVGISRHGEGYGFNVVLKPTVDGTIESLAAESENKFTPEFRGVPVTYQNIPDPIRSLEIIGGGSNNKLPEQERQRDLVCGLEIQNYDYNVRENQFNDGHPRVGTLGCFVRTRSGAIGLLSNNHVLANKNRGNKGNDRITQPGVLTIGPDDVVATLDDFVDIKLVQGNSKEPKDPSKFNEVDAAVALLGQRVNYLQQYLKERNLPRPVSTAPPSLGDLVFKVGCKTGLTYGVISEISITTSPHFQDKKAWFRNVFAIGSVDEHPFARPGDSGAIVMRETGEIVGLIFAGSSDKTYACLIDLVLTKLKCRLA